MSGPFDPEKAENLEDVGLFPVFSMRILAFFKY